MSQDASTAPERDVAFAAAEGIEVNFRRWLRFAGWSDGEWLELQALGVPGGYVDRVRFAHADRLASAVALLVDMERVRPTGIYTIANRINPAVATRATPGRWHDAKKGASTSDRDITHRRIVFIDVDVKRPSGTSATNAELALTVPVAGAIHATLAGILGADVLGYAHSGNGRQIFVAIEETPESAALLALVRQLLAALAQRFTTPQTSVDVGVCDAKRLVPAFGTTKRKGASEIAERAHRLTGFTCADDVRRAPIAAVEAALARLGAARSVVPPTTPARERTPPARGRPEPGTHFDAANEAPIGDVLDALGLRDNQIVTCPGCRNTSGVSLVGNGLKCHHQTCAARGVPGHPGFRTVVDTVAEAQGISPREAVRWIGERFGSGATAWPVEPAQVDDETTSGDETPLLFPEGPAPRRFPLTDTGNAERFVARHGADIRHCHEWKKWLVWDDARWATDRRGEVDLRAIQTARTIHAEARHVQKKRVRNAVAAHAKASEQASSLAAMVRVARALPGIPIIPEQLDREPLLFNCANGTLDLRTGELRPHRRENYITKLAPVAYEGAATASLWERFLLEIMDGDAELVAFLQRAVGYSLTGSVKEHVLFFCYGGGANGKSTFLQVLQQVFGDYARPGAPDILIAKRNDSHPTEIAALFGARLVVCQELDAGRPLAEAMIKKLTGGDAIMARRMAEDFWSFVPTHKFWLAANHKAKVTGTDEAIWRRILLIPFNVFFPKEKRDADLTAKLLGERAGILRWAVEGCRQWRAAGLEAPMQVVNATREYRDEEDRLAAFFDERCELDPTCVSLSSDLYRAYAQWCEINTVRAVGRRAFGEGLRSRGCTPKKGTDGAREWTGLRLKSDPPGSAPYTGGRFGARQGDIDWTDA